jgi:hypothetical protein
LFVFAAWMAANALVLRVVDEIVFVDPGGVRPTLLAYRSTSLYGAMGLSIHLDDEYLSSPDQIKSRAAGLVRRHLRTQEAASHGWCLEHWHGCAIVSTLVVMIWVILTQLGMWTQIRRGLPAFARARRTIMAAANCESCKLPFQALVVALGLAAETAVRLALPDPQLRSHTVLLSVLIPFMVGLILASWISPLRSDFTRQLIGSRGHAVRMYVMYVLIFPLPLSGIIMGLIFSLTSGQLVF